MVSPLGGLRWLTFCNPLPLAYKRKNQNLILGIRHAAGPKGPAIGGEGGPAGEGMVAIEAPPGLGGIPRKTRNG